MKIIQKYDDGGWILYTPIQKTPIYFGQDSTDEQDDSSQSSSKSKKGSDEDNLFNGEMIRSLAEKALPSDMQKFLQSASDYFSPSVFDVGQSSNNFNKTALLLKYANLMSNEKADFEEAVKNCVQINGLNEPAINEFGQIFVIRDRKITKISANNLRRGESPITNQQLANIRKNSSSAAFSTDMTNTLKGAVSMKQIRDVATNLLTGLGSSSQEGDFFVNPNNLEQYGQKGLQDIATKLASMNLSLTDIIGKSASELLKMNLKGESNAKQLEAAISSIYHNLTTNQQSLLQVKARELSFLTNKKVDPQSLIIEMCNSKLNNKSSITMDFIERKTDKSGGKNGDGSGDSGDALDKQKISGAMAAVLGRSPEEDGLLVNGTDAGLRIKIQRYPLLKSNGAMMDNFVPLSHLMSSQMGANVDMQNVTFGTLQTIPQLMDDILITDNNTMMADLPIDQYEKSRGIIRPDLAAANRMQIALREIGNIKPDSQENKNKINQVLQKYKLPVKFNANGQFNYTSYARFLIVHGLASQDVFQNQDEASMSHYLKEVDNDNVREQYKYYEKKGNKNFELPDGFLSMGRKNLYEGQIFIPFRSDLQAAMYSSGSSYTPSNEVSMEVKALQEAKDRQKTQNINIVKSNNRN